MKTSKSPLLIVGTGAMACLFAAKMRAAGHPVRMLGSWREGLEALENEGIRLLDIDGKQYKYRVLVSNDPKECAGTDLALVLVKSYQTARAARQLAECLAPHGLALTLQNGLYNKVILEQSLGADRVAQGVTTMGATLIEPGFVRNGGHGIVSIGEHPRIQAMYSFLESAGFEVNIVPDTESLVWGKLVVNAAINPLTALLRVPNGYLLERSETRELMRNLTNEAVRVAQVQGIRLPFDQPVEYVEHVANQTASNYSSMLRDIMRGSPTEIDSINGAVVRIGEAWGIDTVVNRMMWRLVKALEPANAVPFDIPDELGIVRRDLVPLERSVR